MPGFGSQYPNKSGPAGTELNFGNDEAMLAILKQMAYREGLDDLLADGSKIAAEKIGKGSEKYAMVDII